jgi:hypothetical protein
MRRLIRRTVRINNRKRAGQDGSITLETALVMPMFLLLVFFLLFLVQTSIVTMAVHGALSQSVRLAAASWYPISLLKQNEGSQQPAGSWSDKLSGVKETMSEFGQWLPSPLNDWSQRLADGDWTPEQQAAGLTFRQLTLQLADSRVLDPDRFTVTSVHLPKGSDPSQAFVTVEAEYRLPFRVPFLNRPVVIRSSARERAWLGGTPSKARLTDGENNTLEVSFVSLEPNPVRPGRKATLVLRTTSGASLDLTILYKSGRSQAKHLGSAAAAASGIISWTWLVSGNTTPGEWSWEVTGTGGGSWKQSFQVAGKKTEGEDRE